LVLKEYAVWWFANETIAVIKQAKQLHQRPVPKRSKEAFEESRQVMPEYEGREV
jgi:hypothetical protein